MTSEEQREEELKLETKRMWKPLMENLWFAAVGIGLSSDTISPEGQKPEQCIVVMTKRDLSQSEQDEVKKMTDEPVRFITTGEFRLL